MKADDWLAQMRSLWADPHDKNNWLYETAHDLSQTGVIDPPAFRALAKFLSQSQVIDLYYLLRNYSMRPESEWRADFLKYFKKTISDDDLPEQMADEAWINKIDPETGLPLE